MWEQLLGAGVKLGSASLSNKAQAASTPQNMTNGGNGFNASDWYVATSGSKTTASPIPEMNMTTVAVIGGGLLLWVLVKRKKS